MQQEMQDGSSIGHVDFSDDRGIHNSGAFPGDVVVVSESQPVARTKRAG
jgi:hypothetical protein